MKALLRSLSRRSLAIICIVGILVLIAIPTAIMSGLFSAFVASPAEGLRIFFLMLGAGILLLIVELLIEHLRERRKSRRRTSSERRK